MLDWRKVFTHGVFVFVYGGLGYVVTYMTGLPVEYQNTNVYLVAMTLIGAGHNWFKHRNDK